MAAETKLHRRIEDAEPDPVFYAAMGGDEMLALVLNAFYDRVFVDPVLAHFFADTDRETLKGKQFTFLKQRFTGERVYMGQRPRNAHHRMVISDEEFDYRAEVLRETLCAHGLLPEHVEKWMRVEEIFRRQIVKTAPQPLFYRGTTITIVGEYAR